MEYNDKKIEEKVTNLKNKAKNTIYEAGEKAENVAEKTKYEAQDMVSKMKEGGNRILNKIKARSATLNDLDYNAMKEPKNLAKIALGVGAVLATLKAIKNRRSGVEKYVRY